MPLKFSVVLPKLVSIVGRDLLPPTCSTPKLSVAGLSSTSVPVPVKVTFCGLPRALLSVIDNIAVRDPLWVGLKVMLIVQLAPEATELPHVSVWAKSPGSAPMNLTLVIPSVPVPKLFSVTDCAALVVPTSWVANVRVVSDRVAYGLEIVELALPFMRLTMPVPKSTEECAPPHGADTEQRELEMVIAAAQAGKVEHGMGTNRKRSGTKEEGFVDTVIPPNPSAAIRMVGATLNSTEPTNRSADTALPVVTSTT